MLCDLDSIENTRILTAIIVVVTHNDNRHQRRVWRRRDNDDLYVSLLLEGSCVSS